MDNKQINEQEDSVILPEDPTAAPVPTEPQEETPAIEELSFHEETSATAKPTAKEELPAAEEVSEPEEASADKETAQTDAAATEEVPQKADADIPEAPPAENGASFMERIPDTDLDYPAEESVSKLSDIESSQKILPDAHAMDSHGMLAHGEEEPPFDMSILDDPDLAIPVEPIEEVQDQEYRDNGKEFEDMLHAPAKEKKSAVLPRQTHKGRPKRQKGEGLFGIPNILVTIVWLALIVIIGVTAGRMLWICAADVLAFDREDKPVTLTIYEADTMDDIIDKLYDNGLIRYKSLFKLYADISDAEEDIKPGIYDLNARYDYHALVNFMTPSSSRSVVKVTIPEGYTCSQIFSLLEENRVCTAVDAAVYAANGELDDYWFLEGVERGTENCLEGYLFPDTYEFYKNSTPREALEKMLDNFDYRFDEDLRAKIDALNANVTGGGYSVREVTIVASLIEKESAAPAESAKIAGVIYNRLFNWGGTPAYLNIDAAIVYALDGKTDLTREDLKVDSPYNTYTNIGLTPGPISNPGLSSLKAALNPDSHNYYYYVLNPSTGMHTFSTTYEEHTAYVNAYAEG